MQRMNPTSSNVYGPHMFYFNLHFSCSCNAMFFNLFISSHAPLEVLVYSMIGWIAAKQHFSLLHTGDNNKPIIRISKFVRFPTITGFFQLMSDNYFISLFYIFSRLTFCSPTCSITVLLTCIFSSCVIQFIKD